MRFTPFVIVAVLAGCATSTPTVQVDNQMGDWATVQAFADRECGRSGYARGQLIAWRNHNVSGVGTRGELNGDQRIAEFICRAA